MPRFTTLNAKEREHIRTYFMEFGEALMHALVPGGHILLAGAPMLQHLVQSGMAEAGYEVRGAIMRLYRGFRGGDRPKGAEKEFPEICVTPRGNYEPWMLFRKPAQMGHGRLAQAKGRLYKFKTLSETRRERNFSAPHMFDM